MPISSSKKLSIPECLRGGSHKYVDGICTLCGENLLAATGFSRLRVISCSNKQCGATLSAIAEVCPHCKQLQRPSAIAIANKLYFLTVEPLRIFLFAPRACGINIFEQAILVIAMAAGVYLGSYIRSDTASAEYKFELAEFFSAIVVGILLIPKLFNEPNFANQNTAFIYRLGLAIQKGVFSDLIIQGLAQELAK